MPYSNISQLPDQVKVLPTDAQRVWMAAFQNAFDKGNSEVTCMKYAWGAVNNVWEKTDGTWIKKKEEEPIENLCIFKEMANIIYRDSPYNPGDILDLQFCCVGDNVNDKTLENMIGNFKTNAYGQPIGWHVDHPFFRNEKDGSAHDKRRYGDIIEVYRKGDEGWFKVRINSLGAQILNDRQYISNSPGWFTSYKHQLTNEKINDVLFEISATNIPAEKMMNLIIEMAEKTPMPPMDKPKEPEEEKPEEWDSLYSRIDKDLKECLNRFKNKTGNASRRMQIRGLLNDMNKKMKSEETDAPNEALFNFNETEESKMADEATIKLAEEKVKMLEERAAKAEAESAKAKKMLDEERQRNAKLAEEKFNAEMKTLAESYLPHEENGVAKFKLKKEELPKFFAVASKFKSEEDRETLKNFMESLPVMEVKLGAEGVSGTTPADNANAAETHNTNTNKISQNEFEMKVREEWNSNNRKKDLNEIRKELSEKFEIKEA